MQDQRWRRPTRTDLAVGAGMLLLALLYVFLIHDQKDDELTGLLPEWGDYLAVLALIGPIAWRRMAPAAMCVYIGVGFAVFRFVEVPEGPMSSVAVFLAIHAAGAHVPDRRRRDVARAVALVAGFVALAWSIGSEIDAVGFETVLGTTLSVGLNLAFYIAAWVLGDRDRTQREDRAELARRAELLAAEREGRAQQAVTEERVRIARELHDVVAHHVSVMGVQAAGARHVLHADPARATAALEHVEQASRQAVAELQRLVGVLREGDDPGGVDQPQPDLAGIEVLLDGVRDAGHPVTLRTIGQPRPLPASVELSAYRIVQEALTNVMRHAPGAQTTVVLSHLTDSLQIEVHNARSPGGATSGPGSGRGLLGMRERAALHSGTFEASPAAHGGYTVRAVLPTSASTLDTITADA